MGGFYGSVQVRGDRDLVRSAVEVVANARKIKCLVGPAINGWVGVYPENNGQDGSVGEEIARAIKGDAIQLMVHDDDIFAYGYWHDGKVIDSYWSRPGYFGDEGRAEQETMSGRPEVFEHILGAKVAELRELLNRGDLEFTFEVERLEQFAKLFGISNAVTAYEYLKAGEREGIEKWREFVEVPEDEALAEKAARKDRRKQIATITKTLKADGILLYEEKHKGLLQPCACVAGNGFMVGLQSVASTKELFRWFGPPWAEPKTFEFDAPVWAMSSDAVGKRIAVATDRGVATVQSPNWSDLRELPIPSCREITLSADGSTIACTLAESLDLYDVSSGNPLASLKEPALQTPVIHPSGEWLVASRQGIWVMAIAKDAKARELFVGGKSYRFSPPEITKPIAGNESVTCLAFSVDGQRLWCGTAYGLRGYDWSTVVSTIGDEMPQPRWRHDITETSGEFGLPRGYIYAIVEKLGGKAVIFGGLNGSIYKMNLESGETAVLIQQPEESAILDIVLSVDQLALGVVSKTGLLGNPSKDDAFWKIWSYAKLEEHRRDL